MCSSSNFAMPAPASNSTNPPSKPSSKNEPTAKTLLFHRPRDRSHYERFRAWHESFYRAVEATSVTPFSPRAIDRGIAGVVVAL
ncbi:MAG TPA: hypothetical protein EYQ80_08390, partial [Candidatus Poseidoniales archaeon]|nr:hypothetical protein [Candidatus Poseidoniales archaeon]